MVLQVPFSVVSDSVVLHAVANNRSVDFILDTGDAIGPVFNSEDAERLGLQPTGEIGVSGAGGATTNYSCVATVKLESVQYVDEPSAIDTQLQGSSLLGLPFFLKISSQLTFDFSRNVLIVVTK